MSRYRAYLETLDAGESHVVLQGPVSAAALFPARGFNLYSWVQEGRQVLMPARTFLGLPCAFGIPVLFPTPNRVRGCAFAFRGKTYPQFRDGQPLFIHGLVNLLPFQVRVWANDDGAYCEGRVEFRPGTPQYASFPFECVLTLTYCLTDEGLHLRYVVENLGEEDMPWGFAIHPYFHKMGGGGQIEFSLGAEQRFEAVDCLPTGKLLPAEGKYDLSAGVNVAGGRFDDVYHSDEGDMTAHIRYLDWDRQLVLTASLEFRNMVVYDPENRAGFCLENQTCSTDAHNLYAQGLEKESGLQITPPRARHEGWIHFDWKPL